MASGMLSAIKGGAAYVQAYLDDRLVDQGLAGLQRKLTSWSAKLSRLGASAYGGELPGPLAAIARFAASPAGAFAALIGAAEHTAHAREKLLELSETAGISVEKLSAYGYAARRAGLSTETLATALRKLQGKEFQAALAGATAPKPVTLKPGATPSASAPSSGKHSAREVSPETLAALKIDPKADPTDQLRQITAAFEKLDSVSRIGLARQLGITELLPLIAKGTADLDAMTARAHKLGLVVTEDAALAGDRFADAWADLKDVLGSSVSAIGGALVPAITGLADNLVRVVLPVRDWLRAHQGLTQALLYGSGAIVAGGIVLKGFSVIAGYAAMAVSGLRTAFAVLAAPVRLAAAALAAVAGATAQAAGGLLSLASAAARAVAAMTFGAARAALDGLVASLSLVGSIGLRAFGQLASAAARALGAMTGAALAPLVSSLSLVGSIGLRAFGQLASAAAQAVAAMALAALQAAAASVRTTLLGAATTALRIAVTALSAAYALGRAAVVGFMAALQGGYALRQATEALRVATRAGYALGEGLLAAASLARRGLSAVAGAVGRAASLIGDVLSTAAGRAIKALDGLLGGLASGALALVKKGLAALADVISGSVGVAFDTFLATVRAASGSLVNLAGSSVNLLVSAVTGLGSAIAAAAPMLILLAPIGLLIGAGVAVDKTRGAIDRMGQAARNAGSGAKEFFASIGAAARPVAGRIAELGGQIAGMARNAAGTATTVFSRAWSDISTGFDHVVSDVGGSLDALKDAFARGDLAGVWSVTIEILKLEWLRFKSWVLGIWEDDLLPKVNAAIPRVAAGLAESFAGLRSGWDRIWNEVLKGVKSFLGVVDDVIDKVNGALAMLTAAANTLPHAMDSVKEAAGQKFDRENPTPANEGRGAYFRRIRARGDAIDQAVAQERGKTEGAKASSNLAGAIAPKSDKQLQADADAALQATREAATGLAAALGGAIPGARSPDQRAADAAAIDRQQKRLDQSRAALEAANAAAAAAKPELPPKGRDAFAAATAAETHGTFSGAVAAMMGGRGSAQEEQSRHMERTAQTAMDLLDVSREQLKAQQKTNETIRDIVMVA